MWIDTAGGKSIEIAGDADLFVDAKLSNVDDLAMRKSQYVCVPCWNGEEWRMGHE